MNLIQVKSLNPNHHVVENDIDQLTEPAVESSPTDANAIRVPPYANPGILGAAAATCCTGVSVPLTGLNEPHLDLDQQSPAGPVQVMRTGAALSAFNIL